MAASGRAAGPPGAAAHLTSPASPTTSIPASSSSRARPDRTSMTSSARTTTHGSTADTVATGWLIDVCTAPPTAPTRSTISIHPGSLARIVGHVGVDPHDDVPVDAANRGPRPRGMRRLRWRALRPRWRRRPWRRRPAPRRRRRRRGWSASQPGRRRLRAPRAALRCSAREERCRGPASEVRRAHHPRLLPHAAAPEPPPAAGGGRCRDRAQRHQALLGPVVQVSLDAAALPVGGGDHAPARCPHVGQAGVGDGRQLGVAQREPRGRGELRQHVGRQVPGRQLHLEDRSRGVPDVDPGVVRRPADGIDVVPSIVDPAPVVGHRETHRANDSVAALHAAGDGDASRATRSSTARRTLRVRAVTVRTATPVTASAAEARRVTATPDCGLSARASPRRAASEPSMTSAASTARLTDNGAVAHRRSTAADATTAATNASAEAMATVRCTLRSPCASGCTCSHVRLHAGSANGSYPTRWIAAAAIASSHTLRDTRVARESAVHRRATCATPPIARGAAASTVARAAAGSHDHPAHTGNSRATTAIDSPSDAPTCTSRSATRPPSPRRRRPTRPRSPWPGAVARWTPSDLGRRRRAPW